MTVGPGDALFGQDGTGGDATRADPVDGVGMLPGLDLPVVRLPSIGPDGEIVGLDDLDHDLLGPAPEPVDLGPAAGAAPGPDSTAGAWAPAGPAPGAAGSVAAGAGAAAGRGRRDGDGSAGSASPGRDRPGWGPAGSRAATTSPVGARGSGHPPPARSRYAPRPRVVDEPGILGLSRHSRGRLGSRLFTWFFVLVFSLILIQMIVALLAP